MDINSALIKGYDKLKSENIETYQLDAQLLLSHVLNESKLYLMMNRDKEISKEVEEKFFSLIDERKKKRPMAYILNKVEFMGLDFYVREGVLIPRPDTEILVEECIEIINKKKYINVCDMCCGSGAIGISVAMFVKDTNVWSFDISDEAIATTEINAKNIKLNDRVKVQKSDLFHEAIKQKLKFQMIISNPPYIEENIIPTLMEDVRDYEPHLALSGGIDGLEFYRKISCESKKILEEQGYLCFEIGHNQEDAVIEIMSSNGFIDVYCLRDLSDNPRVVIGRLP